MKKAGKIIIRIIIPTIIALIIIALLALPYIAKYYVNKHGKEYSGRKMSVNQIKINYFTTTFSVIDFKMFEADERETFVSFDTLKVNLNPIHLFASELYIEQIRLVKPEVTIMRNDTIYNFDDIVAFFNSKPQEDTVSKPSDPFKYVLKNISLEKGKLNFTDKTTNYTGIMKDMGFTIPYVSYNQEDISEAGLKFTFENGGFFQAKAGYNPKKGAYIADFAVSQLDISPFLPYTKDYIKFKSIDGMLDGNFHLSGNINNIDSLTIRGDGNVADFVAKDDSDTKVLGARRANVTMDDSYPMKFVFNFNTIALTEPYIFFEMKDSTNNFLRMMVTDTVQSNEPFNYYYQISHCKIDSGLVLFRDYSCGEAFNYNFDEINFKVDSISSVEDWVKAYSTMRLNKRGKLKAELGINPSDPFELKVNYVVTNFQLSDFDLYSKYYVGFPILLGNLYWQGKTNITARQLSGENKLIIRNAKLGKKSGGLMNVPLKLALYILKDVNGDIILNIPLAGDMNNPKTKIGKLVWQTVKNLIVKVVASPFKALSGLLGVDPDDLKGIQFNYADTTITDTHLRRIKQFIAVEKKKPDMKIELFYYNDVDLEKHEIAVTEAGKLFNTATGGDYIKDKAQFTSFLAKKLQSDTVNMIAGSVRLIGNQKLDSIQGSYSKKRISEIEAALYNAENATKIKIFIPDKDMPENVGSRPVFELKYSTD